MGNKFSEILKKIRNLPIPGKVQAAVKVLLFVDVAVLIGLWLGIKIFFPDDFVISKINEQLFVNDLALLSEDVDVSLLGNVSFEEGTLLQKGNKVLTFAELSFSPSIFATLGGHPAGKLHVEDINSQGGGLDASFDTGENPCYSLDTSEVPLSLFKPFLGEVVLTGALSGGVNLCSKEGKYSGTVEITGADVVLRGKVPTPMGDFDVGKIILGEIELSADVADNKAEIRKLSIKGIVELEATGKINLNTRNFSSSRLDLEIAAKVPDMAKITENVALNLLVSQLAQYKGDEENSYAFSLKGFLNKPQMGKAAQKRDLEPKVGTRQQKKPSSRPQRQQRPERLPQRETLPNRPPQPSPAAENVPQQNDDLKKKEDELKRKEEELKRQEEAAKEREEKMREEREQREKEERERKEEEEKKRMEEEARIHAAQEEAMNELRRAREEMEAAKRARETQQEEGEAEPPKPASEEKEGEEE